MKLFTVGPVMMYPETLAECGEQLPYFRTDEFSQVMLDSDRILRGLVNAPDGSKSVFLTASGTGAMEAAVGCGFTSADRVLIIAGGGFGHRFAEICDTHGIPHDNVELKWDEALEKEHLDEFRGRGYAALLVNMDETSTGQLYDIGMISDFCRSEGMLLVVDAISAFLADPIDMSADLIDVLVISSQKALALEPGTSMIVLSPRMICRIEGIDSHMFYLDLKRHLRDMVRGQTPFTPAVGTLLCLNSMLKNIQSLGIDAKVKRTAELADHFRRMAGDRGFSIPGYPLSNAVTPLIFDGDARRVYSELRSRFDMTVTPSGGDLKDTLLRVGHLGNLEESDYDDLIAALEAVR